MDEAQIQRIMSHPEFQSMAKRKTSLGLIFTIITLVFWFGYLLLVGFYPSMFAKPVFAGSMTPVGFYIVVAFIIFVPLITWIYVKKANGEFDTMTRKVIDDINSGKV
ncbi:DUF485 domain-containing protein [Moraxella sp. K23]